MSDDAINRFLQTRGATKCPTAFATRSTGTGPTPIERQRLAAHIERVEGHGCDWLVISRRARQSAQRLTKGKSQNAKSRH